MPVSPGASGMQPRDPCRPWRGTGRPRTATRVRRQPRYLLHAAPRHVPHLLPRGLVLLSHRPGMFPELETRAARLFVPGPESESVCRRLLQPEGYSISGVLYHRDVYAVEVS